MDEIKYIDKFSNTGSDLSEGYSSEDDPNAPILVRLESARERKKRRQSMQVQLGSN